MKLKVDPGTIDVRIFDQGEVWFESSGIEWDIEEMDGSHIRNLIAYLHRGAEHFSLAHSMYTNLLAARSEAAFGVPDDFDTPTDEDELEQIEWELELNGLPCDSGAVAREWMERTELVKALRRELEMRREGPTLR